MSKNRKTIGLIAFLKGSSNPEDRIPGCANYDHHYGGCHFAEVCKVQQGQRCDYFEKNVLPTAEEIGLGDCVNAQYAKQVGLKQDLIASRGEIRRCPTCGAALRHRQRFCNDCSKKRRRETYRLLRQKKKFKAQQLIGKTA